VVYEDNLTFSNYLIALSVVDDTRCTRRNDTCLWYTTVVDTTISKQPAQRVLVTGARGFIGRHLVCRLASGGAEVHAISRRDPAEAGGVTWWQLDLNDPDATRRLGGSPTRPQRKSYSAGRRPPSWWTGWRRRSAGTAII
jgi:NAD dependent epimerase/dehydratase family